MKKIYFVLIWLMIGQCAYGQYNETIRTARPGQAVGPFTTGQYVFQVQSGFVLADIDHTLSSLSRNYFEHTTSLRYGIMENFEIRSAFRLRSEEFNYADNSKGSLSGLSFWNVGFRYNLVAGEKYKPSFGIQTDMKLTWVNDDYSSDQIAPRIMLIHGQRLSEKFKLTTNWSVSWNGNNNIPKGNYVINLSFPIVKKLGGFVEAFGDIVQNDLDTRWDTGVFYLVNNNFLLDISTGYGKNEGINEWFVDAGISWRIKVKE